MRYYVTVGARTVEVVTGPGPFTVDGRPARAELRAPLGTAIRSLLLEHASHPLGVVAGEGGAWELHLRGRVFSVQVVDEPTRRARELTSAGSRKVGPADLRAPMPGLVVKVEVAEGDQVVNGQALVVVEAMKMENELRADIEGRVKRVRVGPGQTVEKNQVLIEFEPAEAPAPEGEP